VTSIHHDDPVFDPADTDPSVDPGVDFYRYVNGGWIDANPVPPEYSRWAAFEEVRTRNEGLLERLLNEAAAEPGASGTPPHWVGRYFAAGMDEDAIAATGIGPIESLLDRATSISSVDDLLRLLPALHEIGAGPLFGASVTPDFDDSSVHLLYLSHGGLGLPERDYYVRDDESSVELRVAYTTYLTNMLELVDFPNAAQAARGVLDLETAMAEPSYTNTQMRNMDLVLNRRTVASVIESAPDLALETYLETIGAGSVTDLNVDNPGFFEVLHSVLSDATVETLQAYAVTNLLRATASSLPPEFEDEQFRFYGTILGGQREQKPRWKRVLRAATGEIGELVAQLYVAEAFSEHAKERALALVHHLIAAMEASIRNLDWMTEATKEAALEKLAGFTPKIGYPDVWKDYTGLEFGEGPWIELRLAARRFEYARRIRKLDEPVDPHEWAMAPHEVNAYYHPLRNEIVFPAGILQPPFFDDTADDAVNYGGIGAVIGHEITHGFDDMGSRFDADGHFRDWWSEQDRAEFERRADVVADQYSSYTVLDELPVNGRLTLGENIADLGGVTIAHAALQDALNETGSTAIAGLTPEQRFFLSNARVWRSAETDEYMRLRVSTDPHSPPEFRCNGVMANLQEFADAFDIPDDAPMMRPVEERAKIW
jgi:putative endopeptidase